MTSETTNTPTTGICENPECGGEFEEINVEAFEVFGKFYCEECASAKLAALAESGEG